MNMNSVSRRDVLALTALALAPLDLLSDLAHAAPASNSNAMRTLDRFIAGYCAAMNAPGLTLGLANAEGPIRVASYGYVDLAAKLPVTTSHLFEIGSITKSFVGLTILQLHEENKVDLQAPIRNYLPWLAMETNFGEILVHHLLTHSSGMPDDAPLIPISPERRPRQALKPGSEFHYSNWGYDALGRLIEAVDGRPWQAAVTARILQPVGMRDTSPTITSASRPRIAQSYVPLHDDRPYPRHGALVPAGNLSIEFAAGSIASTPKDMSLYMQMILNHGQVQGGRVISEDSFKLFSTPHIPAPAFGPTAGYGYGIAVDKLDGHVRLRHTGGMVSFMSAIHMDLDAKMGAFASINAQLGYRPNPVAELALQLLRAEKEHSKPPAMPAFDAAAKVESAESYGAVYTSGTGRRIEIRAASDRLSLLVDGRTISLQQSGDGNFIADQTGFDLFPISFERAETSADATDKSKAAISALTYGSDWYARAGYEGQKALEPSAALAPYTGEYYSENPWFGTVRVVQRQRRLWTGGTDPLIPIGDHLFRIGEEANSPGVAEFSAFIADRPNLLWIEGTEFRRIEEVNT
ncbi:MAG TPA: serine hydrolase domain-containing protein [Steroidobacteraceae bacterium]|nr:serine hydrolase domain-containing protein [Steroidobacteraceae bacterium]